MLRLHNVHTSKNDDDENENEFASDKISNLVYPDHAHVRRLSA
jgi:hypothetical protein